MKGIRYAAWGLALTLAAVAPRAEGALGWVEFDLSVYGGYPVLDETMLLDPKPLVGTRLGLTLGRRLGIEGNYGTADARHPGWGDYDFQLNHVGVGLVLNVLPESRINPYLAGGLGELRRDPQAGETLRLNGWEFGGGTKVALRRRAGFRLDLRLDARRLLAKNDTPLEDPGEVKGQFFFTGGLQFSMREVDEDRDVDGDGVRNRDDRCPDTPAGAVVDPLGCPLDRDEDGVPEGLDACPWTPRGARVDARGCPMDADGDGVADGLDQCEKTPPKVRVDVAGCPLDSDGDGVYDGLDLCADTPLGTPVDETGCPVLVPPTPREAELVNTGVIRLENVYFRPGSAVLNPESAAPLDEVGEILVRWPQLEIEIGGHTDGEGSEGFNLVLSRSRAQAVLDYLASRFPALRLGQFVVQGYGESQPVAGNETPEGRAANRRVEFRVKNPEMLRR